MSCNTCPPSPIPPWHRPVQSPVVQTLNEDLVADGISMNVDVTYLDSIVPLDAGDLSAAYQVALPNGNYQRQIKRIFVVAANALTTAAFEVTGTFVGFSKLRFFTDENGMSAVLEWDGAGWHVIGGNAALVT